MRVVLLVLVSSMLALGPAAMAEEAAVTPPRNVHLEEAKALYGEVRYAEAVPQLELAIAQPGNSREELAEIYALLGTVHVALGHGAAAEDAFRRMLDAVPDYRVEPEPSPKVRAVIERARASSRPPLTATTEASPAPPAEAAPWYAEWRLWAGLGAVAAVGATTVAIAVWLSQGAADQRPPVTLGEYRLGG